MNKELEQKLVKECPNLFKYSHNDGPPYWPIKFGIDTEKGWDDLIAKLCYSLEPYAANNKDFAIIQIKEKFGGLRFYVTSYPDKVDKLISDAEFTSYRVCEHCGVPGKLIMTKRNYYLTACQACEDKANS